MHEPRPAPCPDPRPPPAPFAARFRAQECAADPRSGREHRFRRPLACRPESRTAGRSASRDRCATHPHAGSFSGSTRRTIGNHPDSAAGSWAAEKPSLVLWEKKCRAARPLARLSQKTRDAPTGRLQNDQQLRRGRDRLRFSGRAGKHVPERRRAANRVATGHTYETERYASVFWQTRAWRAIPGPDIAPAMPANSKRRDVLCESPHPMLSEPRSGGAGRLHVRYSRETGGRDRYSLSTRLGTFETPASKILLSAGTRVHIRQIPRSLRRESPGAPLSVRPAFSHAPRP